MTTLNEDTLNVRTTQYRLWSFPPETLSSLRSTANTTASTQVHKRRKLSHPDTSNTPSSNDTPNPENADPLTPQDELHALQYIHLPLLTHITTTYFTTLPHLPRITNTASQYLRRYYLTHSLMAPTPSQIPPGEPPKSNPCSPSSSNPDPKAPLMNIIAAIYLAIKVHDTPLSLADFVRRIHDKGYRDHLPGAQSLSVEGMKRAEAGLTRTLRFCFEVRHPNAGVEGLELELKGFLRQGLDPTGRAGVARDQLLAVLGMGTDGGEDEKEVEDDAGKGQRLEKAQERVSKALKTTKELLNTTVHKTDAYFLHTPAQILFAALFLADEPLGSWYLGTKLPSTKPKVNGKGQGEEDDVDEADPSLDLTDKVFATVRACAEMLRAARDTKLSDAEVENLKRRLAACHDVLDAPISDADGAADGAQDGAAEEEGQSKTVGKDEAGADSETSRATSVKRNGAEAFESSAEDEDDEDEDVVVRGKKKKKKRRKIEDDDVFGGPL